MKLHRALQQYVKLQQTHAMNDFQSCELLGNVKSTET